MSVRSGKKSTDCGWPSNRTTDKIYRTRPWTITLYFVNPRRNARLLPNIYTQTIPSDVSPSLLLQKPMHHHCAKCRKVFGRSDTLGRHMKQKHNKPILPPSICPACGKKVSKYGFQSHWNKVHKSSTNNLRSKFELGTVPSMLSLTEYEKRSIRAD
jgi:hypothetical protein